MALRRVPGVHQVAPLIERQDRRRLHATLGQWRIERGEVLGFVQVVRPFVATVPVSRAATVPAWEAVNESGHVIVGTRQRGA